MYIEITRDDPRYIENDILEGKGVLYGCACPMIFVPWPLTFLKTWKKAGQVGGCNGNGKLSAI